MVLDLRVFFQLLPILFIFPKICFIGFPQENKNMVRPSLDSRLKNIETDMNEIKEIVKNGNNSIQKTDPVDCMCEPSKELLKENEQEKE